MIENDDLFEITDRVAEKYKELNDTWTSYSGGRKIAAQMILLENTAVFVKEIAKLFNEMKYEHRKALMKYTPDAMGVILADLVLVVENNAILYQKKLQLFTSSNFEIAEKLRKAQAKIQVAQKTAHAAKAYLADRTPSNAAKIKQLQRELQAIPSIKMKANIYELSLFDSAYEISQEILKYLERFYPHKIRTTDPKSKANLAKKAPKKAMPTILSEIWGQNLPADKKAEHFKKTMNLLKQYYDKLDTCFITEIEGRYQWLYFDSFRSYIAGFICVAIDKGYLINKYDANTWVSLIKNTFDVDVPVDYFRPAKLAAIREKFHKPFLTLGI